MVRGSTKAPTTYIMDSYLPADENAEVLPMPSKWSLPLEGIVFAIKLHKLGEDKFGLQDGAVNVTYSALNIGDIRAASFKCV